MNMMKMSSKTPSVFNFSTKWTSGEVGMFDKWAFVFAQIASNHRPNSGPSLESLEKFSGTTSATKVGPTSE